MGSIWRRKRIIQDGAKLKWIGAHPEIDEKVGTGTKDYAFSYLNIYPNKDACIVIDISVSALTESLEDLNLGMGSITGFITADNRELTVVGGADLTKKVEESKIR